MLSIGASDFTGDIEEVVISVLPVNVHMGAFYDCVSLRTVTVPHPGTDFREGSLCLNIEDQHAVEVISNPDSPCPRARW